jgi:hypothetical protein
MEEYCESDSWSEFTLIELQSYYPTEKVKEYLIDRKDASEIKQKYKEKVKADGNCRIDISSSSSCYRSTFNPNGTRTVVEKPPKRPLNHSPSIDSRKTNLHPHFQPSPSPIHPSIRIAYPTRRHPDLREAHKLGILGQAITSDTVLFETGFHEDAARLIKTDTASLHDSHHFGLGSCVETRAAI